MKLSNKSLDMSWSLGGLSILFKICSTSLMMFPELEVKFQEIHHSFCSFNHKIQFIRKTQTAAVLHSRINYYSSSTDIDNHSRFNNVFT